MPPAISKTASSKSMVVAIHEQRPKSGTKSVKLHHDNAKSHVVKVVKTYLEDAGVGIIHRPWQYLKTFIK